MIFYKLSLISLNFRTFEKCLKMGVFTENTKEKARAEKWVIARSQLLQADTEMCRLFVALTQSFQANNLSKKLKNVVPLHLFKK